MTHDKEEYLLTWKNIHSILWNHGSYTRVWLLVWFFLKEVSMNIHEKEKQTKTGGG